MFFWGIDMVVSFYLGRWGEMFLMKFLWVLWGRNLKWKWIFLRWRSVWTNWKFADFTTKRDRYKIWQLNSNRSWETLSICQAVFRVFLNSLNSQQNIFQFLPRDIILHFLALTSHPPHKPKLFHIKNFLPKRMSSTNISPWLQKFFS